MCLRLCVGHRTGYPGNGIDFNPQLCSRKPAPHHGGLFTLSFDEAHGARFDNPITRAPVSLFLPPALPTSHASFPPPPPPFPPAMLLFLCCSNPLRVYSTNKSNNKSIYPFPLPFALSLDCSFRKLLLEHRKLHLQIASRLSHNR